MKRYLFLSIFLLVFSVHVVWAWDLDVNREKEGRQTGWKWRLYTPGWGTPSRSGPSQILYVYDAGGGRNLSGNVDLAWDLWDSSVRNAHTGEMAYLWYGNPYTVLGDGLFKDTGITGISNMNFTHSSSMIIGGSFTPINIQAIGSECFRNSSIQGTPINYTPNSITSLGAYAFAQCRSLTGDLITPANVPVINDGTYQDCTGLSGTLWITDGVTSIGAYAFNNCSNMSGGLHLSNTLQSIGAHAFNGCSKLTGSIIVPNTVTAMGDGAFANCTGFNGGLSFSTSLTYVPHWAFYNCHNLAGSVVIPASVQAIGHYAFNNCVGLNGGFGIYGNCTSIGNFAFANCPKLIGNLDIRTVTSLGVAAFQGCSGFNGALVLSNSLSSIPEAAFNGCSGFTGNLNIPSATSIDKNAFYTCGGFNGTLSLPGNLQIIGEAAFFQCTSLRGNLHIPSAISIGNHAFQDCIGFDGTLSLPANLQSLGYSSFWNCSRLRGNLVFPVGLQSIGQEAFAYCYNLTGNVTIPVNITTLRYHTFWECSNLESFTFAAGSRLNDLDREIFPHCISLKYVDMINCPAINIPIISRDNEYSPFGRMRPYTMVYLPNGTNEANITAGQENFVVDGKCSNFKVYDVHADYKSGRGCDYEIKHQFVAAKANYTRTFSGTDAATLFLPYPTTLPVGMTAYELRRIKRAGGESYFVFSPLPSSAMLEANKAYVVRVTDGVSHNLPEMHNVVVPVTPSLATTGSLGLYDADWMLNGTTQYIAHSTAVNMKAYNLNTGDTWLPITNANTNGHIRSFRAFLTSPTGVNPAKSFVMVLDEGPIVTDINAVKAGEADVQSGRYPYYSLDGRNLGYDYNSLSSGNIYIVNGKKFYKN